MEQVKHTNHVECGVHEQVGPVDKSCLCDESLGILAILGDGGDPTYHDLSHMFVAERGKLSALRTVALEALSLATWQANLKGECCSLPVECTHRYAERVRADLYEVLKGKKIPEAKTDG